jgi:SAM-dependent methyltransferase
LIHAALGDGRTVLNVGAGTGSYEPRDRFVIAAEPSRVMLSQRNNVWSSPVQCSAAPLPLGDNSVDAAMAILTVHHWDDQLTEGIEEMRRVTRGPIVVVTYDVFGCEPMWLTRDYLPEATALDQESFPTIELLDDLLGGGCEIVPIPVRRDTPDWTFASFWAHPHRVLDPAARQGTSGFSRQPTEVVERVVQDVERDLMSGEWDRRNGHLGELDELDVGLRLVVADP